MRRHFSNIVVATVLVLSASCSTASQPDALSQSAATTVTHSSNTNTGTSKLVEKVSAGVPVALTVLERSTISGDAFVPASLAGREVLLWFWAPW
ncbi:MAG: hypothetical protein ACJZ57_02715 [Candidatus Poriferisodalaceae bacterium]|nr:MAG: hypothetical protein CNE88_09145 [Acidimicrobiales bacterium MED-G01]